MTSRIDYNDPKKDKDGTFSVSYHYEMLSDERRLAPFIGAIRHHCPGKVVFESGTGSGVLSILAATCGAARVFCTEIDPRMADVAASNIVRSGCADKITLLPKSTLTVLLDDLDGMRPDVIIAENLSTWQVTEPQNEIMNHLLHHVAHKKTITIPARADNYVELCESAYRFLDLVELRAHYFEFTGIPAPSIRSERTLFSTFEYSAQTPTIIDGEITIPVSAGGVVNSLRLTSPLAVSDRYSFDASDSLMPPVIIPLPHDIAVSAGERLSVSVRYTTNTAWEKVVCSARRLT